MIKLADPHRSAKRFFRAIRREGARGGGGGAIPVSEVRLLQRVESADAGQEAVSGRVEMSGGARNLVAEGGWIGRDFGGKDATTILMFSASGQGNPHRSPLQYARGRHSELQADTDQRLNVILANWAADRCSPLNAESVAGADWPRHAGIAVDGR